MPRTSGEMKALAESFAGTDARLDFALDSLDFLEGGARAEVVGNPDGAGAYIGELIRRRDTGDTAISWVDTEHGPGLMAGDTLWFPLNKAAKFAANGSQDSLRDFVQLVVASHRPPVPPPMRDDSGVGMAAARFMSTGSAEDLLRFAHLADGVSARAAAAVLPDANLHLDRFVACLGERASGRGQQRKRPGWTAARWIPELVQLGIVSVDDATDPLTAMMAAGDKTARRNAAFANAICLFEDGQPSALHPWAGHPNAAVRVGTQQGVYHALLKLHHDRNARVNLGPLAPTLSLGLRAKGDELTAAVRATRRLSGQMHQDIGPLFDEVLALTSHSKPAIVADAVHVLTAQMYSVMHGWVGWNPRLAEALPIFIALIGSPPSAKRVTKVQIAASYGLRGVVAIRGRLDPAAAEVLDGALGAAAHIR